MKVLVTGSEGLIGTAVSCELARRGHQVRRFDLRCPPEGQGYGDIRHPDEVVRAVRGCDGVIHLAAISRVVDSERDPENCIRTNVEGTANVVDAARSLQAPPWLIFASSREVYGEPDTLPVAEDAPLRPLNTYGRSKLDAEKIVEGAPELSRSVLRLANVYGSLQDHPKRVLPAFCRTAARGGELTVEGPENVFDFTHVTDVAQGIVAVAEELGRTRTTLPPLNLACGEGTTTLELAKRVVAASGSRATIRLLEARNFDVCRYVGSTIRARELLGWEASTPLQEGIERLLAEHRRDLAGDPC